MKKLLLLLLFIILSSSQAFGFGREIIDNCSFTVTSTINLTSSNTSCETPGGSTTWGLTANSCGINLQANSADYAETSAAAANCTEQRFAPTDIPSTQEKGMEVTATFIDGGTLSSTDVYCIYTGTSAANYYSVCGRDDASLSFRVYKRVSGVDTSLGTFGAMASGESSVITLRATREGRGITAYENGAAGLSNLGSDIYPNQVGIGCGALQVSTDDCPGAGAARWDSFKVTLFYEKWQITDLIPSFVEPAQAQETIREGRWYISPVVHSEGVRVPKLATINDPGAPLLLDNDGNATIPQQCLYSAAIGDADVTDEWALVYALCYDYSAIEADPDIKLLVDEKVHHLNTKLSDLPSKSRVEFNKMAVEKAKKPIPLSANNSVKMWLDELGKEINPKFSTRGIYTTR